MASALKVNPFHLICFLVCVAHLAFAPQAAGYGWLDDAAGEADPVLVRVSIISEIRGVRDIVEINGRPITDYSPTIVQTITAMGIAIDPDHVMTCLGNNRWIDVKSHNPRIEITANNGQTWNGKLIGVDQRNGAAVFRLLNGKLQTTPVCAQCEVKDGVTVMAPVLEGSRLSQYQRAQILSVGAWPGIPKQSGWRMAMNRAMPDINLPILTADRRVLGIIASQDAMARQALVYPIAELLSSAQEIIKVNGDIRAGWLGVYTDDAPSAARSGIPIREVLPDSPAQKAGLRSGDVLVRFGGKSLRDTRQFVYLVEGTPVGSKAAIEILRQGKSMDVEATIGARRPQQSRIQMSFSFPAAFGPSTTGKLPLSEPPASRQLIGLEVSFLTPYLAETVKMPGQTGFLVTDVVKGMPADEAGVLVGDVIRSIDGRPIVDPFGFASYLMSRDWNSPLVLKLFRKETEHTITIDVKK
jgi:S1-C subfamily serine protease